MRPEADGVGFGVDRLCPFSPLFKYARALRRSSAVLPGDRYKGRARAGLTVEPRTGRRTEGRERRNVGVSDEFAFFADFDGCRVDQSVGGWSLYVRSAGSESARPQYGDLETW